MRYLIVALGLAVGACERGDNRLPPSRFPATAPASRAESGGRPPANATVHDVTMELRGRAYVYEPQRLTIRAGDTVRWINVSGGPHNVAFYPDRIPPGAADVLRRAMRDQLMPLSGPMLIDSLASYEISFAGAPAGTYSYYCLPHEPLGMKATLTVER